jgi:two-component system CheB/CheR fusion protein
MSKRPTDPQPDPEQAAPRDPEALASEVAVLRRALDEAAAERALGLEREAQLRGALQHRVRNMLAIIRSISARTFGISEEDESADHFRGRLDALARIEVRCGGGRKPGCDLEELIRDELRMFEFDESVDIRGPEVRVPHEIARLLGLAIHELATNAIKFGALAAHGTKAGLTVRWTFARGRLRLSWTESGVAVVGLAPPHIGFGREYIEQAMPYQIDAETRFELQPGGISCTIEVDLSQNEEGDGWPRAWV